MLAGFAVSGLVTVMVMVMVMKEKQPHTNPLSSWVKEPGTVAYRESTELLFRKLSFLRLVREIAQDFLKLISHKMPKIPTCLNPEETNLCAIQC